MDNQFLTKSVGDDADRSDVAVTNPIISSAAAMSPSTETPPGNMPQPVENAPLAPPPSPNPFAPRTPTHTYRQANRSRISPTLKVIGSFILVILIIVGAIAVFLVQRSRQAEVASQTAADFDTLSIPLADADESGAIAVDGNVLSINGQLRANGSLVMAPAAQPSTPTTGQIYYDQTSNHLSYYNGTEFVQLQTNQDATGAGGTTTNTTNATTLNSITNLSVVTNNVVSTTNPAGGTTGKIAKFTSGQTLGDSILTDKDTFLQVDGGIDINAASTTSDLSLFTPSSAPTSFDSSDTRGSVELGVKFQVDVPGVVKAIRFYKGPAQVGTFTGDLWTSTGTLLGQATFTTSGSGWQQVSFPSPIPVSPDTTYIASYHNDTPSGTPLGYPFTTNAFGSGGVDNGPLHGLASGIDGGNGVFKYTASPAMPNGTFFSTNYWVDVVFSGAIYNSDSRIKINGAQISTSDLVNDANIAKRGSSQVFSGHNIFRNPSDSINEFSIQQANTTELLSADSLNGRIYIGPQTGGGNVLLVLNNRIDAGDPPNPTDGAMYYHTTSGVFRCYSSVGWSNCNDPQPSRSFSVYDEFLGGQTTSFGTNNIIGSLGWNAQAIGANGSIDFNPATPAPAPDRPGVLALTTPAAAGQGTTLMLANSNGASTIIRQGNTVRTAVAVGATTGQVLRVGLHGQTSATTQPVSGVWWEADPAANANWRYCYGNGTAATCANSTVAITADTWVRLSISVNTTTPGSANIFFGINSNTHNVTNATIDTTNRISPAFSCYGTSGSAQSCFWDYYQFTGNTSAAR